MVDIPIQLSGIWVAVVLLYLYGDVLRIFSGDFPNEMDSSEITKPMWLGISVIMSVPIMMVVVSLIADYSINRWTNIITGVFFFLFVLVGIRSYPSAYDRYLMALSMVFNIVTVLVAWNWVLA